MSSFTIQFGLETEIGITREAEGEVDVVDESIALVRCAAGLGVSMCWDYGSEDPHVDMRGFRVGELRQDTDESNYFAQDADRELSFTEIKSDMVLGNGARFYNDHAHPEYCTPECHSLRDLIAHDKAGERILIACAQRRAEEGGGEVRLYKNNTDFFGHSYGCHENYLLPRSLSWDTLAAGMQAFLVTRQIFAGAGKFGIEEEDRFVSPGFQIAQRSDFFSELQSVDTMQRRPLINTRDEPHANAKLFRRFHVIIGDANMSAFATRLKVGSTALVLQAMVRDPGRVHPILADPLGALPAISRDPTFKWEVGLMDSRRTTALEIQWHYLNFVRDTCPLDKAEEAALVADWKAALEDLASDPMRCADRLDWVAKLSLIRAFQEQQGLAEDDPWLRSLDLEYHRLDLEQGLFYGLEASGSMRSLLPEQEIQKATSEPPMTRAFVRGKCVQKFGSAVLSAQWDHITLQGRRGQIKISLLDLFAPGEIARYAQVVERAREPDDLRILANMPS